jgi:signal transduction histidine kinase
MPSLTHADLLALAPLSLRNGRKRRYHGDNLAIPLAAFTEADQKIIRRIYLFLTGLFDLLSRSDRDEAAVMAILEPEKVDALIEEARMLGQESYQARKDPLMAKTIHDLRGGGLSPLLGLAQVLHFAGPAGESLDSLFFLTRDHLKIMRNALLGLDDTARTRDLEIKLHSTDLIVKKWNGTRLESAKGKVRLEVDCPESLNISECCVEFGALDRILYNLLNNACRHTAAEVINLALFPVPDRTGDNLRFALSNAVAETDEEYLRAMDMRTLFQAGVSTTGSGYGLNVVSEFVANAFGLQAPDEAVAQRYVGAILFNGSFVIWFHWPIVAVD